MLPSEQPSQIGSPRECCSSPTQTTPQVRPTLLNHTYQSSHVPTARYPPGAFIPEFTASRAVLRNTPHHPTGAPHPTRLPPQPQLPPPRTENRTRQPNPQYPTLQRQPRTAPGRAHTLPSSQLACIPLHAQDMSIPPETPCLPSAAFAPTTSTHHHHAPRPAHSHSALCSSGHACASARMHVHTARGVRHMCSSSESQSLQT